MYPKYLSDRNKNRNNFEESLQKNTRVKFSSMKILDIQPLCDEKTE